MLSLYQKQNKFRRDFDAFVNNCGNSRLPRIAGLFSPGFAVKLQAGSISRGYIELESNLIHPETEAVELTIPLYDGNDTDVRRMMSEIASMEDELSGAYVHGSLATGERVSYSDFDALIVIKSEVVRDPVRLARVASKLLSLRRIMIGCDPLQHHGWMTLTDADLFHYCDAYFPLELFRYSRSLLESRGRRLTVFSRDSFEESRKAFESLSTAIIRKTGGLPAPRTLFELKSLLSQFMLLPSLYIQATQGKGIYKKHSFDIASRDFPEDVWKVMNVVSEIRQNWPASDTGFQNRILSHCPVLWHRHVARFASPSIPSEFETVLTRDFYDRMSALARSMRDQAQA